MFERKGVQHLIRALEGLDLRWEVVIAGDGPYLNRLKDLASKLAVPVRFLGFVQGESLRDLYRSSRLFVFPSVQENFPVVLLEAMAYGCAVITTSADGCREVVGDAAIAVEPGNADSLRSAILQLVADEDEVARLVRLGRRRVQGFAWDRVARDYEELYRDALERS
jgi:glycosyltransferase involved in cell wall biosynthesis